MYQTDIETVLKIVATGVYGQVLSAYLAFAASSSGVEQHFSKVDRCHLERGSSANDTFCRSVIALADNGNEASDKQLLERAREIFAEGRHRLSYKKGLKRRDAGVQRATTSDPKDEGGPGAPRLRQSGCGSGIVIWTRP